MSAAGAQIEAGKRPFYKHASPETTLAILRSRCVRYSSPLLFNDPFDVQTGLHFDFDLTTLHAKVLDRLGELAAAPQEPEVIPGDVWGQVVLAARAHFPKYGFPRDRWAEKTAPSFAELVRIIEDTQRRVRDHWQSKLLPSMRVFCVTEERDNLLMWAHYSKDHTGAVFEFWSLPEEDNSLCVAKPVVYTESSPPFFSEREWLDDFMGLKKLDVGVLSRRYASAKSRHWAYEKEWRVWYPLSSTPSMHDTVQIRQNELRGICFGCRANSDFVAQAKQLVADAFPNAMTYQARKEERSYGLSFHEI